MKKDVGYVYILTNPSFKEDWIKIGKSSRPVDIRSKELDNTAVPLPFDIYATIQTTKYNEVEKMVHKTIDRLTNLRIRQNREFFNIPPDEALGIFQDIATTIDDAKITRYENNKPIQDKAERDAENKNSLTDTNSIQLDFWNKFNEKASEDENFMTNFKLRKPQAQNWYDLSVNSSAYHICMTASRQKQELTTGIYINNDKNIYHQFLSHSSDIENDLGNKVQWKEANKSSHFFMTKPFKIDDKQEWDKHIDWLLSMNCKFKKIAEKYG